jgi:hypothetical protein
MDDALDLIARRLVAMAELDDGILTDFLKAIVSDAGGTLVGLDNRIKRVESLKRKLADMLALDSELTLTEAAERVYDVLRFTVVAAPDTYMAIREAILAELGRQSVTVVEERNRWAGVGYRGINTRLCMGVTQRFEIQFHTRESYGAAKATRGQYEELRRAETSPRRAAELATIINEVFAEVPIPPGAVL